MQFRLVPLILTVAFVVAVPAVSCAQTCTEYFTSVWGNPLDMSSSEDVLNNIVPLEGSNLSEYRYANGIFTTTATSNDPHFRILTRSVPGSVPDEATRYGDARPVDTATYKELRVRMNTDRASLLMVFWENSTGTLGQSGFVSTAPGWNTYTVNVNVSTWNSGPVYSLRVDPTLESGAKIEIDFIELVSAGCTSPETRVATFRQPDREGGEDYFAAVKSNPTNFNASNDIEAISGHSAAQILPSNSYQDSAGAQRRQDYLEAINNAGQDDPVIHLVFPAVGPRIDAGRYKIACWTFDVLAPITEYHSVVRFLWSIDGTSFTTDDFLTRTNGEARYCTRMDTVPLEPTLPTGQAHPWRNNASGAGIDFFRFDPHEDLNPLRYRLVDMRLAADHEADKKFAIVINGERSSQVDLSYRIGNAAPVAIGSLPAGRTSDVFLWNTEALPNGTYTILSKVGLTTFVAPGVVIVDHSGRGTDSEAPRLQVDTPLAGQAFDASLQVVGYAVDNRRVAAVEAKLGDTLLDSFAPSLFDARAREAFPTLPYGSEAGFNRFFDTTGIPPGAYTFTLAVYDTAGNTTVHTAAVAKQAGAAPTDFNPPFSEARAISVPQGVNPGAGGGGGGATSQQPRLSVRASARGALTFSAASRGGSCPELRLLGATSQAGLGSGATILRSTVAAAIAAQAPAVPKVRAVRGTASRLFFGADCGAGTRMAIASIDASRLKSRATARSLAAVLASVVKKFRVG